MPIQFSKSHRYFMAEMGQWSVAQRKFGLCSSKAAIPTHFPQADQNMYELAKSNYQPSYNARSGMACLTSSRGASKLCQACSRGRALLSIKLHRFIKAAYHVTQHQLHWYQVLHSRSPLYHGPFSQSRPSFKVLAESHFVSPVFLKISLQSLQLY